MPPILESPVSVAVIESVNLLDAQIVTTADEVCVFPVACPAPEAGRLPYPYPPAGATLSVQVADGIGLSDRLA